MLNAVGVDVSKGKSTISVLQPGGVIVRKPFDVTHSKDDLKELARYVKSLDGETKVVMECTGRYHEPLLRSFLASDRIQQTPGKLRATLLTTGPS